MAKLFQAYVVEKSEQNEFTRSFQTRNIIDLPYGELLVRVDYSSINYKDALSATGNPGVTRNFPHTPGIDAVGVIIKSLSQEFPIGEKVIVNGYDLGMNTPGGFGQYIRVPSHWVTRLPEKLDARDAMRIGTAGFTAAMSIEALVDWGVSPEDGEILVTGATGGVGSMAIAILSKLGYEVVAVTGKKDSAENFLKEIGAHTVITREEATDTSRPLQKARWAGVVDCVGGPILETALAQCKPRAAVAISGLVATEKLETTVFHFILRGVAMFGIDSAEYPIERRRI